MVPPPSAATLSGGWGVEGTEASDKKGANAEAHIEAER